MELSELLEIFDKEITSSSYKQLVSYAQYILSNSYLWRRSDKILPEGKTAEDFVQETIMKFVDGERKWNPPPHTEAISYLKGNIKSVINNNFVKKEQKITLNTFSYTNEYDELLVDIADACPDTLNILELRENINNIYEIVKDDEGVKEILVCYEEGIYKRQEIADTLEISPDEVTARFKRLERRLRKFNIKL